MIWRDYRIGCRSVEDLLAGSVSAASNGSLQCGTRCPILRHKRQSLVQQSMHAQNDTFHFHER